MAIGDLYRLTMTTNNPLQGAVSTNVFFYQVLTQGGSLDAENVADDFISNVLAGLFAPTMANNWEIIRVLTQNLNMPEDFNDTNPQIVGGGLAAALPGFISWTARSPWPGTGQRRAYKRFPAGTIDHINDSGVWTSGYEALIADAAFGLGQVLVLTGGTLEPVIVRRGKDPETEETTYTVLNSAAGLWEYSRRPDSQVSRKPVMLWSPATDPSG